MIHAIIWMAKVLKTENRNGRWMFVDVFRAHFEAANVRDRKQETCF